MSRIRRDTEAPALEPESETHPDPERCLACIKIRDERSRGAWTPVQHCYACGSHDSSVRAFEDDTPCLEDRGKRLCSGCQIPALRRRATCPHEWAAGRRNGETCGRCALEIQGHRELFREYMRQIAARAVAL